jgi:hypothetical protein
MHKYRRLLGEVLVASFFLQLLVLVTPLFFHRQCLGASQLHHAHGLMFGLIAVAIFEAVLGRQTIARKDVPEIAIACSGVSGAPDTILMCDLCFRRATARRSEPANQAANSLAFRFLLELSKFGRSLMGRVTFY